MTYQFNPDPHLYTAETFVGKRSFDSYLGWAQMAQLSGHAYWFRGVPVTAYLHKFLTEIRVKRFDILPGADNMPIYMPTASGGEYRVYNSVGITFPDMPDHRVGRVFMDGENFCVESPKIQNEKYSTHSDGYRIRKSKDLKKMLKVALQYLKPLQFADVMNRHKGDLEMAVFNVRNPVQERLRETLTLTQEEVLSEVQHMVAAGYTPTTNVLKRAIQMVAAEGEELKRLRNYKPRTCFVWAKQGSLMYQYSDTSEPVEIVNLGDLPEVLNNKLAVLNIAEEGSTIPDVGVRINKSSFWVFV